MSFSNKGSIGMRVILTILACCIVGGANADSILGKGKQLPYDIYLSGTFTSWVQDEKTEFRFDKNLGLYVANNLKAGPTSADNPRRFKITGKGWQHQFGLTENKSEISVDKTSLMFVNSVATALLQYFADMKDIHVSLPGDKVASSDEELLDFYLQIQAAGPTPKATLKVVRDIPPLANFYLKRSSGETVSLSYQGDGVYSGGVVLPKGTSNFVLNNSAGKYFDSLPLSSGEQASLNVCKERCELSFEVSEQYVYQLAIKIPNYAPGISTSHNAPIISLNKLDSLAAKSAAPHFDATGSVTKVSFDPYPLDKTGKVETVEVSTKGSVLGEREFTFTSTQQQRDDKPKWRTITEKKDAPQVVTASPFFDGLFALTIDDMRLNSVSHIRDANYNQGQAIPCNCFETGEKWNYVWTRDLSYAVNLSLANLEPQRSMDSMLFKTSKFREGVTSPTSLPKDTMQIIQDTGSGGSWPVSTDRVSWSVAAESVLNNLSGSDRQGFAKTAYASLVGTIEADRQAIYDYREGLYGGEQSYLDWRTQTYAPWITKNLVRMSESKALSTNVLHYQAISLTAKLAKEFGDVSAAKKYSAWADSLRDKINSKFWLNDKGLYSSLTSAAEDQAPVYKFDMLGNSLAINYGIASADQATKIMANYPHAPFGVPVYFPQQPNVYVYHNRSLWPFVTAYSLRAAKKTKNYQAANNAINSLMRGTALHLSNMENLEWLTGKSWYDDGPAINSRRQLWSTAGYLGMVTETLFGYEVSDQGIEISPFLTSELRSKLGASASAQLNNINYHGKKISINLLLPPISSIPGYFEPRSIVLNGKNVKGTISESMLTEATNVVEVTFGKLISNKQTITMVPSIDPMSHIAASVFSPVTPEIERLDIEGGKLRLVFMLEREGQSNDPITYNVYRNGEKVATGVSENTWIDSKKLKSNVRTCYALEAVFVSSANRSHHSEPMCYEENATMFISVADERVDSNVKVTPASINLNKAALIDWGKPTDRLIVNNLIINETGSYSIQAIYNNRQHTIDSGVTAAVKGIRIFNTDGDLVNQGIIQMPNIADNDDVFPFLPSSEMVVKLKKGVYQIKFDDFFNMSYLETNATYGGSGGKSGPVNTATIAGFKVTRLEN
ncbi:amylo-alpha-1,6-glucosidase [Cellvibrio sp. UBA7671]|uniref:alpha-L-rhamnosidase-related protein n=1 Tax=Cellvibrio sp. UBA7671 TaxID=1946312 RepID=UPI002F35F3FE